METRPVRPLTRILLVAGSVFVFAAGTQLYVLSAHTSTWFAWTIANPLTAATVGAFYYAAVFISAPSSRQRSWEMARVGLPGILVFVWLTLIASLIHLDVFHLHATGWLPRLAAYAWLAIYLLDPPLLLIAYLRQLRSGPAVPRESPMPTWYRLCCAVLCVPVLGFGVVLYADPVPVSALWAWPLTPIAAQVVAAWLVALGALFGCVAWEADWRRCRPASLGLLTLAVFQAVALVRYPYIPHGAAAAVWLSLVVAMGLLGGYGTWRAMSTGTASTAIMEP